MYILNPTQDQLVSWFQCRERVAKYLIKEGLPIISIKDGFYYFVKTDKLQEVLDKMPFWLKWLI